MRQEKSRYGKPAYLVLWDTQTNQPATQEELADGIEGDVSGFDRDSRVRHNDIATDTSPVIGGGVSSYDGGDTALRGIKSEAGKSNEKIESLNVVSPEELSHDSRNNQPETEKQDGSIAINRLVGAHCRETEQVGADGRGVSAYVLAGQAKTEDFRPLDSTRTAITNLESTSSNHSTAETGNGEGGHFFTESTNRLEISEYEAQENQLDAHHRGSSSQSGYGVTAGRVAEQGNHHSENKHKEGVGHELKKELDAQHQETTDRKASEQVASEGSNKVIAVRCGDGNVDAEVIGKESEGFVVPRAYAQQISKTESLSNTALSEANNQNLGDHDEHTNCCTDVDTGRADRAVSEISPRVTVTADAVNAQPERYTGVDAARSTTLVDTLQLPTITEKYSVAESDVSGEREARNGGEISQGSVAEVIEFPARADEASVLADNLDDWDGVTPCSFEDLLARFCVGKTPTQRAATMWRYRQIYKATGEIPVVLLQDGRDGRKGRSGKKTTLTDAVLVRFEALIKEKTDKDSLMYSTKRLRRVTVLHRALERELGEKIAINKLRTFLKNRPDLEALRSQSDGDDKPVRDTKSYPAEPVGKVILMDGVTADYFQLVGGDFKNKPLTPTWIELFDMGSRKFLAMHAYASESNASSCDIFDKFIRNNQFMPQHTHIRPDNAKGFLNLKPVLHDLNNHIKARKDGFMFIDDFARPLKAKDKAHLESSHRLLHDFEGEVIDHFYRLGKVIGKKDGMRKVGNRMEAIKVTLIDATLEELNASGLTERYVAMFNNESHRFTEENVTTPWIPSERWESAFNEQMADTGGEFISFGEAESRVVRLHGCRKKIGSIGKNGLITFNKVNYKAPDSLLNMGVWSRTAPTKVWVGQIEDGSITIFSKEHDGRVIGELLEVAANQAPKHITDKINAKIAKTDTDTRRLDVIEALRKYDFTITQGEKGNYHLLTQLFNLGLDIELTKELLKENKERYSKGSSALRINYFATDVKRLLKQPEKITPYALKEEA